MAVAKGVVEVVRPVEAAKVEVRSVEAKPVEAVKVDVAEPRAVAVPPEAVIVGEKVPRVRGGVEIAARRTGGAFFETFLTAVKSRPVQVVASFGMAFVAAGLIIYLAPKILTTLLTTAGASAEQATWIVWALAIVVGIIVFVIAWRLLIRPATKVAVQ